MRTRATQGPRRRWRAAGLVLTGATALLLAGAVPALANTQNCQLKPVIVGQPTTTQAGSPVTPPVVVDIENSKGQIDTSYSGWVKLSLAVNPDGAAGPAGNVVQAVHGVATFSQLTFASVGFGFELAASIPGTTSAPSQPFDIVGQLVHCQAGQPCQSGTVSSDGTSGVARAGTASSSAELAATGGGFPSLSCGTLGGVLTFSSTRQLVITMTLSASIVRSAGVWSFNACWGAPQPFITKDGRTSAFNQANDEYEGLLPACGGWGWHRGAPCVLSRYRTWTGAVVITVLAPAGDPRIMGA